MPLGFTDKIRFQVEQNICQEGGDGPQPDCFDRPCNIVYNFLSKVKKRNYKYLVAKEETVYRFRFLFYYFLFFFSMNAAALPARVLIFPVVL